MSADHTVATKDNSQLFNRLTGESKEVNMKSSTWDAGVDAANMNISMTKTDEEFSQSKSGEQCYTLKSSSGSIGYKGVQYHSESKKYTANIQDSAKEDDEDAKACGCILLFLLFTFILFVLYYFLST